MSDAGRGLVTTEDVLRAVLESPREIKILAVDRNYRYLAFNSAHRLGMKAAFNLDVEVGQNILDLMEVESLRRRSKENLDRVLAGEHFAIVEAFGEHPLGKSHWEISYCPIVGADGAVHGATVFHIDITAQKRLLAELEEHRAGLEHMIAERTIALRRSEELYRTLVDNAPIAVFVHRDATLLYVNPAAVKLVGAADAPSLLERPVSDVVSGGPGIERAIRTASGDRVEVEWTSIEVEFEGGLASLALAVDISSRKRAEEERYRLEEQMRETQKLESLGLLAGGIAHDFNNLLVGILGNVELALRSAKSGVVSADHAVQLQRIKTAAIRASELTGQMLAYAGKERFVVGPIDLNDVARETADLAGVSLPLGTELVFDLAKELPAIEGDGAQIRQIVMNLVINAAEALGETTKRITLRTSVMTSADEEGLQSGRYVCLEVTDTGVGMDEATRKRMFDPFFTTKASGRGLGLAAVVGIVRAHAGLVRVTTEVGKGSRVRVFFPCGETVAAVREPDEIEDWHVTGTVLIADDEPRVRQVLAMMLEGIGLEVLEAGTAQACLALYRENAGRIDAVMVDLEMPGGGGRAVVRELRAEGHEVPVVISSGYSREAIGDELRSDRKLAFLEKPFEFTSFVRTLKSLLGR